MGAGRRDSKHLAAARSLLRRLVRMAWDITCGALRVRGGVLEWEEGAGGRRGGGGREEI